MTIYLLKTVFLNISFCKDDGSRSREDRVNTTFTTEMCSKKPIVMFFSFRHF